MSEDEKQIRQLVERWMAASKAGDTEGVLSMVADDVVFLGAGRPPIGKTEFATASAAQTRGGRPDIEGASEIQEIKVLGDWAFMWTTLKVTIRPPGAEKPMVKAGYTLTSFAGKTGTGSSRVTRTCLRPHSVLRLEPTEAASNRRKPCPRDPVCLGVG